MSWTRDAQSNAGNSPVLLPDCNLTQHVLERLSKNKIAPVNTIQAYAGMDI